jgi:predicted transcriptional regulator
VRDQLAADGRELAYTTVATLVRILGEKGFLEQTSGERPFRFRPARSFDEVSRSLVGDLVDRVFGGSREKLLMGVWKYGNSCFVKLLVNGNANSSFKFKKS